MSRFFPSRYLTRISSIVAAALAIGLAACGNGDTGGGGSGGAGTGTGTGDAGMDAGDQPWLRATASWASLYDVYFGPTGVASCSNGDTCHTSLMTPGGISSNFVCADKDGCYMSLTGQSNLVKSTDMASPEGATLFKKLRQAGTAGTMPSNSMFTFQSGDVSVIEAWIKNGAMDD
jgi:hypothetical protein